MRRLLLVLGSVLVILTILVTIGYFRFNQNPFEDTPYKLLVCGRTYVNPASHSVTQDAVDIQGLTAQAEVQTWHGKQSVWGTPQATDGCGLDVFLKVKDNQFRGFNLQQSH